MANYASFSTMKTNVGNLLHDTGATMGGFIGVWLNECYSEISRQTIWSSLINWDYTFESVADTATYDLPEDFGQELFLANIAKGEMLERFREGRWWHERHSAYQSDSIGSAVPRNYIILPGESNLGKIQLDPPPLDAETYALPYQRIAWNMLTTTGTCTTNTENKIIAAASTFITSGVKPGMRVKNTTDNTYEFISTVDSNTQLTMADDLCPDGNEEFAVNAECLITDAQYILEAYACAMGWAYQEEFNKSNWYMEKFNRLLAKRVGEERRKVNQMFQRVSGPYRIRGAYRFSGDSSYDTI